MLHVVEVVKPLKANVKFGMLSYTNKSLFDNCRFNTGNTNCRLRELSNNNQHG